MFNFKPHTPYFHFNSPSEVFAQSPANVVWEIGFFVLLVCVTIHAWTSDKTINKIVWICCLIMAFITELFTLLSPEVGNFWHSQFIVEIMGQREVRMFIQFMIL